MSLINNTYFVGDIALPNLDEVTNTFQVLMDRYETEILQRLLGFQLHKEFIAALADTPAQKWIDLRDGAEFTFDFCGNTVTQKWNGLINSAKISLISYYVYYQYRNQNINTTTSINDVRGIPENADRGDDSWKVVNAWNRGHELYGDIDNVTCLTSSIRSTKRPDLLEFDKYSADYDFFNDKPSAFNFLNAKRADYDNWVFDPLLRLNVFGI
jgi:hypothetical protein